MAKEIRITKKNPRVGDEGHRIVSVRMKEELIEELDSLSAETNRSRNELINILLESAIKLVIVDDWITNNQITFLSDLLLLRFR